MTTYVALLRAVNVGGTGQLAMADLRVLCEAAGLRRVQTYVASGNVVFDSAFAPARVRALLEERLLAHMGRPVGVLLRTAAQLRAVLHASPFAAREPRLTYVFFFPDRCAADTLDRIRGRGAEEIHVDAQEIHVYYPQGMGQSKLKLPAAQVGTARNMQTVARLVALAERL